VLANASTDEDARRRNLITRGLESVPVLLPQDTTLGVSERKCVPGA
jgi:hypothetical protein